MNHNRRLMRIHKATIADGRPTTNPTIATMAAVGRVIAAALGHVASHGEDNPRSKQRNDARERLAGLENA